MIAAAVKVILRINPLRFNRRIRTPLRERPLPARAASRHIGEQLNAAGAYKFHDSFQTSRRLRYRAGLCDAQGVVHGASNSDAKEPAVDAPPRRKQRGEIR